MFIIISKCLGGCSAARQFNHMIHSPSERSGLAVHHGEQRKWSQGDRSRLCVGKRHPTARLEQGGPRASPLILETVPHQNFLISLVGETSLQMLIIMYNLARFLAVLSGKKSREVDKLFTELHAGKRRGSFISMHKKKDDAKQQEQGTVLLFLPAGLYTRFFDVLYPRHKWTILHCQRTLEPLHRAIGGNHIHHPDKRK